MWRHMRTGLCAAGAVLVTLTGGDAATGFVEQFNVDLALSPYFTWWSNNAKARATANVSDAQASDGRVLDLLLPKRTSEDPVNGPNLQSKVRYLYGTFEGRLKTGQCANNRTGVVTSFFTYFSDGTDGNGDGLADNSEIDLEWLCAAPESIYLTAWTDYDFATGTHRRVVRKVNLAAGTIEYTRFCWDWGGSDCQDLSQSPAENQPPSIPVLPSYNSASAYYEYGFEWTPNSITWWIVNPANGQRIILWDYRGPADHIPQVPAYYMANLWHSSNFIPEGNPSARQSPKKDVHAFWDWLEYTPL